MIIKENTSLKPYNTFGIDVRAKQFAEFSTIIELQTILDASYKKTLLILGGGSNILFTEDFDGFVLKNNLKGITKVDENSNHIWLKVQAGENWHQFVLYCIKNNYAGIENLSLIPGTVGAAPMQNIGAYGVEVKDVIEEVHAIAINDNKVNSFSNAQCQFAYRHSIFKKEVKNQYVITDVVFRLNKIPEFNISYGAIQNILDSKGVKQLSIQAVSEAICEIRQSKLPDPAKIGNGGSFFKNPEITSEKFECLKSKFPAIPSYPLDNAQVKIPAAWLIDQAGWKGKRFGDVGVHENQALVLVNYGNGKGKDIWDLAKKIQASVLGIYDISLVPEINVF